MLVNRKGIDDLLLAFKNSLPSIPRDIVLTLYGDDYGSEERIEDRLKK